MSWVDGLRARLNATFFRSREEAEMDEELGFHLEMEAAENAARGMAPAEARRRAALAFGGVERTREEVRESRGFRWIESAWADLRFSARSFRRDPGFTALVVLTLSLGVGAAIAIFTIADALLLRPLPYQDPDRLAVVMARGADGQSAQLYMTLEDARVWSEQTDILAGLLLTTPMSMELAGGGEPRLVTVHGVSGNFHEVLGVLPVLGRSFTPEDAAPDGGRVILLSHGFWRSAFGSDEEIVGRTVELDGSGHLVIGVMPPSFRYPQFGGADAFVPFAVEGTAAAASRAWQAVARIRDPLEIAQARLEARGSVLDESAPRDRPWGAELSSMERFRRNEQMQRALVLLGGGVTLFLLAGVVNAVGLIVVRSWSRTREFAIRAALGSGRGRAIRLVLVEILLLSIAAGGLALMIGFAILGAIRSLIPPELVVWAPFEMTMTPRTALFAAGLTLLVGIATSVVPAARASRVGGDSELALSPHASTTPARGRARRFFLVIQMALTVVLMVGGGLTVRSFVHLMSIDPGYRVDGIASLVVNLPQSRYPTSPTRRAFGDGLQERLLALPGVVAVSLNTHFPPSGGFTFGEAFETGQSPPREPRVFHQATVTPDFFDVLDVRVVAGRELEASDADATNVILTRTLAEHVWPGEDPIGRVFRVGSRGAWLTVVGLTEDLRLTGPVESELTPDGAAILYPLGDGRLPAFAAFAIRTSGDPDAMLPAIRAAVAEIDPALPVHQLASGRSLYLDSVALPRFLLVLMMILAGLGLSLALVGIHGVLSYEVVRRRREIGVRMALGGSVRRISAGVVRDGLGLTVGGVALGLVAATAAAGVARGLLYGVEPVDPWTLGVVAVLSLVAATSASLWPAYRAASVPPNEVLRLD